MIRSSLRAILAGAAFVLGAAVADACPRFENSIAVGVDRNGGTVDVGDLIDWTLSVINDSCDPGDIFAASVRDPIVANQEFVEADKGGTFDPATGRVTWDPSTTPELAAVPPLGGTVVLHLTTRVTRIGDLHRACNRATIHADIGGLGRDYRTDDPATAERNDPTCIPAGYALGTLDAVEPCSASTGEVVTMRGTGFDGSEVTYLGRILAAGPGGLVVEVDTARSMWAAVASPWEQSGQLVPFLHRSPNPAAQLRMAKVPNSYLIRITWEGGPWNYFQDSEDPRFPCGETRSLRRDVTDFTLLDSFDTFCRID